MCIEYNQLCPETSTWKSKRNRLPTKYPTAAQVTRISDFAIESEIRKRISPPTNLSSCWISITKSKSGFYGFPFYSSIGKSEKGFAKVFSWTVVFFLLIKRARARPLFFKSFVSSDPPPLPKKKKKRKGMKEQISQRWNPFSDFAFDCKSEILILKSKTKFPNQTHPRSIFYLCWFGTLPSPPLPTNVHHLCCKFPRCQTWHQLGSVFHR